MVYFDSTDATANIWHHEDVWYKIGSERGFMFFESVSKALRG